MAFVLNVRLTRWQIYKSGLRIRRLIYSRLYRNPNTSPENSIFVAGAARSGTTWLAEMVSRMVKGRILFEPFNSRLVGPYSRFHYFQYMRPGEAGEALETYCRRVLAGEIRHPWIDRQVDYLNAAHRVVKAIRANLLLGWIHQNFPRTPLIFIIRHPCAVVLSRMRLNWDTDRDIESFLAQPELVEDFLGPFLDTIARASTNPEKHAVIWCISNLVPLSQSANSAPGARPVHVLFYEHLYSQPEVELRELLGAFGYPLPRQPGARSSKPSYTSAPTSTILTGGDQLGNWRKALPAEQVDGILKVVDDFGLSHLYGDGVFPV